MNDTPINVFIDHPSSPRPIQVGKLWSYFHKGRESAFLEYNRECGIKTSETNDLLNPITRAVSQWRQAAESFSISL